jgi:hypothetical protein
MDATLVTSKRYRRRSVWLLALLAVATGLSCSPGTTSFKSAVLHQDVRLDGKQFSGQSLLLFPIFTKSGFVDQPVFSAAAQAQILMEQRQDLRISTAGQFEQQFVAGHGRTALERFYQSIFSGDILTTQTSDTVWHAMPCRYALLIGMPAGIRVRGYDDALYRQTRLQAELWDTRAAKVVLRLQATGNDTNHGGADSVFIRQGLSELFSRLPPVRSVIAEENW